MGDVCGIIIGEDGGIIEAPGGGGYDEGPRIERLVGDMGGTELLLLLAPGGGVSLSFCWPGVSG
jgi:hypothetical protein